MEKWIHIVISLMDKEEYKKALEKLNTKIDISNDPTSLLFHTEILLVQNKLEDAANNLKRLVNLQSTTHVDWIIDTMEGIINWLKGDIKKASHYIDQARSQVDKLNLSTDPLAAYWLSYLCNAEGLLKILSGNTLRKIKI